MFKRKPELVLSKTSLSEIRGLILDMDGVLWHDQEPIGDLPAIFGEIHRRGWKVSLVTNNATLSAAGYQEKLAGFSVQVAQDQIVNSAQATAAYLRELHPGGGKVFLIGENGLEHELAGQGFISSDQDPLAVIVGMDRELTYDKLKKAVFLIRSGAPFIATNGDRTFPTPQGQAPGAGAIVAAVQTASNCDPVIIGKPSPLMYRLALERMKTSPGDTLVVGDRLETDIAGAQSIGCQTALVLSGVTNLEQALAWKPAPDQIARDLSTLLGL